MFAARTIACLAAAAAVVACGWAGGGARRDSDFGQGDQAIASILAAPWVWTDERGQKVTFARWRGEPLVVTAIYTSCQVTCPRTIGKLRKIAEGLRREGRSAAFLLVTIDPDVDTPERLRIFKEKERLPDSWHLLAGSAPDTREFTDLLNIHVMHADSHIVHDARIVVFDAQGRPARSFSGYSFDEEAPVL